MTNDKYKSREVRLLGYRSGALKAEHFEIVETVVPTPGPGQVVVRNRWFRVSISTRLMAEAGAESVKGIPFPPLLPGDTLADGAIGEVVQTAPGCDLAVGSLVLHPLGWREYALVRTEQCKPIHGSSVDPVVWLGHGWTAYAALVGAIQVRSGDTVFVTSGAGAIGSMAGQIARLLGATRIIGSTSGAEKARWMRDALGYDAVITRDGGPIRAQLAEAAPEGIDVIVDMVGGDQLASALEITRHEARCVLLGAVSAELNPHSATLKAPVELDTFQLILRGVTMRGFSADEQAPELFDAWINEFAAWQESGRIHLPHTTHKGLDAAPLALEQACAGRLRGVVLVELPEAS
ncbi:NADP-dependent oxidoreductase [Xanthomonas hyacinthi]|uniref:NADP-dependent oxidoreductase n=1 Tax=Xanthomonas hyacinthi TaxID=56455 RepID=A0A2S7EQL3_9XANT|nr:NADP-dependent oxidoreductase [Xanthomonas hyacinthi]KLD75351.1 alcohol dehydrogenase [Xanthomonas hyacinthi DSM 19077]PPU95412.1 NADP-dependent oxidoreductase [Xanthomonas hyacinthi]QGY78806.1 NADP-dependent oxidoreductase [Xanthomonas hyacinthi]